MHKGEKIKLPLRLNMAAIFICVFLFMLLSDRHLHGVECSEDLKMHCSAKTNETNIFNSNRVLVFSENFWTDFHTHLMTDN